MTNDIDLIDNEGIHWTRTERYAALRQQLAECQKENERLKTVPMKYRRMAFNAQLQDENLKLEKQLAECQAALALKDEVLSAKPAAWLHDIRQDSDVITDRVKHVWGGVAIGKEANYGIPLIVKNEKALAIKPDNSALREWGARVLEEIVRVQVETYGGTALLPHEISEAARDLRSGEWTPEILK